MTDTEAPALYPWQAPDWARLHSLRERLPHALLLHGREGIGKLALAERFAQSLLCETPKADGQPCDGCASCGWFQQYSHPDYRRVRPEALEEDAGDDSAEGEEAASKKSASSRAPSKEIRIEQVRALSSFLNVSTHRAGLRVVLLYPAEALNAASANALLKMLEEPPPGTVFLLVSHRPDRLLPTILSRCRKIAQGVPDHDPALRWLNAQGIREPERWLAEQGGAPLAALAAAEGESAEEREAWLGVLAQPAALPALAVAERLQKAPLALLTAWLQRWLYDLLLAKHTGQVRFYPLHRDRIVSLAQSVSTEALNRALQQATERRRVADHPLSGRLFIEDLLLDYLRLFP